MSSVLPSSLLFHLKKNLYIFFVVLVLQLFFIAAVLFMSKSELQNYCSRDISLRLENYLQRKSIGALSVEKKKRKEDGLQGLSFVRLISGSEQFFYAESQAAKIDFQSMVNLDPRSSAVWVSLADIKKMGSWAVTSRVLDTGLVVQAGIKYDTVVGLYDHLRKIALLAATAALVVAGGITFIAARRGARPLQEAEKAIGQIVSKRSEDLLDADKDRELAGLYDLLNRLIGQNRQLVVEMQNSLDNVAHDLRTPMTRLRSVAEYGLQQNTMEQLAEALSDCLEESERVLSMLAIMMSVAEAESGTMQLNKVAVPLLRSVKDVATLYDYVAEEKNIHLEVDIDEKLSISGDKTRITQVWANIVDNAIKYGREGGRIKIYAGAVDGYISLVFEDNGMGISASELPRIWERLFRGDRSRSQQGLGLGLNYVRAVVEAHRGEVTVESRLAEGSRFTVKLPID